MSSNQNTAIREQLLAQHKSIRELAEGVVTAARHTEVTLERAPLEGALSRLYAAVSSHNANEEKLLRSLLRSVDAWGKVRENLMDDHHVAEHASLLGSLAACAREPDVALLGKRAGAFVHTLLRHMDAEEKELLHPDVLRDDIITVAPDAG